MTRMKGLIIVALAFLLLAMPLLSACTRTVEVPVEKEVIKEVPVEKEVIKEVPVVKEVVKEVEVEKLSPLPDIISLTTTTGATNTAVSMSVADALRKNLDQKVVVEIAEVTIGGITLLRSGQSQMIAITTSLVRDPVLGLGEYDSPGWGPQPLRILVHGAGMYWGMITSKKTGIKTFEDVKGKRVAYFPASHAYNAATEDCFKAHGFTYDDVQKVSFESQGDSFDGLMNGVVDVVLGGLLSPKVVELDATVGAQVIGFSDSPEVAAIWAGLRPNHALLHAPKDAPGYYGITEDMILPGSMSTITAYSTLSEDWAYQLAKGIYEVMDEIGKVAATRGWTQKIATSLPAMAPFHPGAIKFYKEVGMWTAANEEFQQKELAAEAERMAAWKAKLLAAEK
ncbi:MAG: TAXI family TRAP transporter solute-binding subunit [Dehalococcoidales bacterium]|nr:TAXI family TRAP transporter solute-binding subunit [Dehalococcoidales bacterium]